MLATLHSESPLELLLLQQRLREPTHQHQLLPLVTTLHSDSSLEQQPMPETLHSDLSLEELLTIS
jgi:hypothetical protein